MSGADAEKPMSPALQNTMCALQKHLSRVIVPILQDYPVKGLDQTGTGTFIEYDGRVYLLTAWHTFDGVPAEQIRVPDNPYGPGLIELWPFEPLESDDGDDDIIALRLSEECASRVGMGWTVIPIADCGDVDHDKDHAVAVAGYPSKWGVREGERIGGTFVVSYTEFSPDVPADARAPLRPEFDMFLHFSSTGTRSDNVVMESPRMGGVSGAPI